MIEIVHTASGPMDLYIAEPEVSPKAAIIVLQEAFGITEYLRGVTDALAKEGYLAIAPQLFHRHELSVFGYDQYSELLAVLGSMTAEEITEDLNATFAELAKRGFAASSIGALGFCMGGSIALYAGTQGKLGAAVSFYGGGVVQGRFGLPSLVGLAPQLDAPWLGHYGLLDKGIPLEHVNALDEARLLAKTETQLIRYEQADHGFHCQDRPEVYNESDAAKAWDETLAFFAAKLIQG